MLKVGGLVLLVLGIVAGAAGGVGLYVKPEAHVVVPADLSASVLVIPPEVVALAGDHTFRVEGSGFVDVRTARPTDAEAWLAYMDAELLNGIDTWEQLNVTERPATSSASAVPSDDVWRSSQSSPAAAEFTGASVDPGATVVVVASEGAQLSKVTLDFDREVGFGWVIPALSGGALLAAAGIVLLVIRFLEARPTSAAAPVAALPSEPTYEEDGA